MSDFVTDAEMKNQIAWFLVYAILMLIGYNAIVQGVDIKNKVVDSHRFICKKRARKIVEERRKLIT